MPTEAVTTLYAGLDLHKTNVFCGLIDQEGQPIYRRRLPAELPTILQALEPYRPQLKAIAVESTFNWYWLVDGLQAAALPGASGQSSRDATVQRVETDRRRNRRLSTAT